MPYSIPNFNHLPHLIRNATPVLDGVMSAADKAKLDSLTPGGGTYDPTATRNYWPYPLPTNVQEALDYLATKANGNIIYADEYGAVGYVITTTGTIDAGSHLLTLAAPENWKVGTGIGVAGAGAAGVILQTTVTGIDATGLILTLSAAASVGVVGAAVTSEDGAPIQAGLDFLRTNGGGILNLLAGNVYVLGIPNGPSNQPLFVGSDTILNLNTSTIQVCDNAIQLHSNWTTRANPLPADQVQRYPDAAAIVNYANTTWHAQLPWPAVGQPFNTPMDMNVAVINGTIDMNGIGQPYIGSQGNRTGFTVPDPIYTPTMAAAGGGSLIGGDTYNVAISWIDANGNETSANPGIGQSVALGGGDSAITVSMCLAPPGAVDAILYINDNADPVDTTTYPGYPNTWVGPAWQRVVMNAVSNGSMTTASSHNVTVDRVAGFNIGDVIYIPGAGTAGATITATITGIAGNVLTTNGTCIVSVWNTAVAKATYTITAHDNTLNTTYPPGVGTITKLGFDSSTSYGFYIDNCNVFICDNITVIRGLRDGIVVGAPSNDSRQTTIPHPVLNASITNCEVNNALRCGVSITGVVRNIFYSGCDFNNNSLGCDLEIDASFGGICNVVFDRCNFRDNYVQGRRNGAGSGGLFLFPHENNEQRGVVVTGCVFDNNFSDFECEINEGIISVNNNTFSNSWVASTTFSSIGYGLFEGNIYWLCGKTGGTQPTLRQNAQPAGCLQISISARPRNNVVIQGNSFIVLPLGSTSIAQNAIKITGNVPGVVICNNFFDLIQTDPFDSTKDVAYNYPRILSYSQNNHLIYGNRGNYIVQDFRSGAYSTPRINAFDGAWMVPRQHARQDTVQQALVIPSGATFADVVFHPNIVADLASVPAVTASVLPGYIPRATFYWDNGGVWFTAPSSNSGVPTQAGFRVHWKTAPGSDTVLDWEAEYLPPQISSLDIGVDFSVAHGSTHQMAATGTFVDGSTAILTQNNVVWSSSNLAVATVSSFGLVTGVAAGTATISCRPPVWSSVQADGVADPTPNFPQTVIATVT